MSVGHMGDDFDALLESVLAGHNEDPDAATVDGPDPDGPVGDSDDVGVNPTGTTDVAPADDAAWRLDVRSSSPSASPPMNVSRSPRPARSALSGAGSATVLQGHETTRADEVIADKGVGRNATTRIDTDGAGDDSTDIDGADDSGADVDGPTTAANEQSAVARVVELENILGLVRERFLDCRQKLRAAKLKSDQACAERDELRARAKSEAPSNEDDSTESDREKREGKIQWVENKLAHEIHQHTNTKTELTQVISRLKDLSEEKETIKKDYIRMCESLQYAEAAAADQETALANMKALLVAQQKAEIDALVEQLDDKARGTAELVAELSDATNKIQDMERVVATVDHKTKYIKDLERRVGSLTSDNALLIDKNADLEAKAREFVDLNVHYKQLKEKVIKASIADSSLIKVSAELENMKHTQQVNEQTLEAQEKEIHEARARESGLVSKATRLDEILPEYEELKERASGFDNETKTLMAKVAQLAQESKLAKDAKSTELMYMMEQYDAEVTKSTELQARVKEVEEERRNDERRHAKTTKQLRKELQQYMRKQQLASSSNNISKGHTATPDRCRSELVPQMAAIDLASGSGGEGREGSPNSGEYPGGLRRLSSSLSVESNRSDPSDDNFNSTARTRRGSERSNTGGVVDTRRRQDKLDKLEAELAVQREMNTELIQQLQSKNTLLRQYFERERTGTLATAKLVEKDESASSPKGSFLSNLMRSSTTEESGRTLERSKEISATLQALLEDTLLKNIALHKNVDTLAHEISRLTGRS